MATLILAGANCEKVSEMLPSEWSRDMLREARIACFKLELKSTVHYTSAIYMPQWCRPEKKYGRLQ